MNCQTLEELLTPYLLGDLEKDRSEQVRGHLETCAGCRALKEELVSTLDLLRNAMAADDFAPARLDAPRRRRIRLGRKPLPLIWLIEHQRPLAVAAGFMVFFGLVGALMIPSINMAVKRVAPTDMDMAMVDREMGEMEGLEKNKAEEEGGRWDKHYSRHGLKGQAPAATAPEKDRTWEAEGKDLRFEYDDVALTVTTTRGRSGGQAGAERRDELIDLGMSGNTVNGSEVSRRWSAEDSSGSAQSSIQEVRLAPKPAPARPRLSPEPVDELPEIVVASGKLIKEPPASQRTLSRSVRERDERKFREDGDGIPDDWKASAPAPVSGPEPAVRDYANREMTWSDSKNAGALSLDKGAKDFGVTATGEPSAPAGGEVAKKQKMVPLRTELPKPLFVGTPSPVKVPNLEKRGGGYRLSGERGEANDELASRLKPSEMPVLGDAPVSGKTEEALVQAPSITTYGLHMNGRGLSDGFGGGVDGDQRDEKAAMSDHLTIPEYSHHLAYEERKKVDDQVQFFSWQKSAPPPPAVRGGRLDDNGYTVQPGDNLFQIAKQKETTVDELVRLNELSNPDQLWAGQKLNLPAEVSAGPGVDYSYREIVTEAGLGTEAGAPVAAGELENKLDRIVIPKIEFREANIRDVKRFLKEASIAGDPDGKGIDIVLDPSFSDYDMLSESLSTVDSNQALAKKPATKEVYGEDAEESLEELQVAKGVPDVTLNLRQVSMHDAVRYITEVANLDYRIEDERIVIAPAASVSGRVEKLNAQATEEEAEPVFKAAGFNPYVETARNAFSTFSIDVDTAAYTLTRRYMLNGALPPAEAVRTEEFVNFFDYDYRPPSSGTFAVYTEYAPSPFGQGYLLKIGVKGKRLGREEQRRSVLTFVIDTSGSMNTPDRLGLLKDSLRLLVEELDPADQVAIVQYGSQARLILDHTPAGSKQEVLTAIERLQASGSTHLEEGLRLGYEQAAKAFIGGADNRVLLLSDGMANLGSADAEEILSSVETYRRQGIFCSVFGFGLGTYNDELLETLANKGDGVYQFIDSEQESRRVFVDDLAATLNVIAKDVKIQVEFNPRRVHRYRQIGYENRQLAKEDFRNDAVDAGEVGSGQSVTALYEVDPRGAEGEPLGTVRIRYQDIRTGEYEEIEKRIDSTGYMPSVERANVRFKLAASVAEFAEILRGSPFATDSDYEGVAKQLRPVALELSLDQRVQELLRLVHSAGSLPRAAE